MTTAHLTGTAAGERRGGFTLVEVLVAVSLLVMIILVASYIFETTIKAVGLTQANNELNAKVSTFYQHMRGDLAGIEPDGFLVIGRRQQQGFGSARDRANENKRSFRNDWMSLFLGTEQAGAVDGRLIGQRSRVFYGHGRVTDVTQSGFKDQTSSYPFVSNLYSEYSNLGTDWVLMRHQVALLNRVLVSNPTYEGVESPSMSGMDYVISWKQYERSILCYAVRDFRWYGAFNYQWIGTVSVPYGQADNVGDRRLAVYEPTFYHVLPLYTGADPRRFYALAQCAEFKLQYAMAEDLRAGTGGAIRWRDPPAVGESGYYDPNFRAGDAAHPTQTIPTGGDNAGRLVFGPGDRWPALLKVGVQTFDPSDRFEGGRQAEIVIPMP